MGEKQKHVSRLKVAAIKREAKKKYSAFNSCQKKKLKC